MEEMLQLIADQRVRSQVERVVSFHGYLSTGAFIGIQMLNMARLMLEISEGERIFVTCETYNCLPDPFQILAGATIGNKGLKILDHGKMAATIVKRGAVGSKSRAVRIVLDPAKTARYPRLHAWFMKSCKVPHPEAVSLLIEAGESVYSWEILEVEVPGKPRKVIAICQGCNDSFIQRNDETLCQACLENMAADDLEIRCNPAQEKDALCPQS